MGCSSCSTGKDGKPGGCKSNGGCSTGGCNRLNTFDWLSKLDISEPNAFDVVEVSFSNGSRKDFYHNPPQARTMTGDTVVVETDAGYDIGHISLSGELVRMQMRKKRVDKRSVLKNVIRRANPRDIERMQEARNIQKDTMIRARAISRTLGLDMKIGDVEYQADKRKVTFYYTADGRVDFRELIRHFAKEFKVKIEMRQIGARQESARIGGIGSCGRELCCSTWLSDFKTVSTTAARYQNLAINQSKLSGQCGRLKCCLNYELDTYIDALEVFPKKADKLRTEAGLATLVKTDIFKGIMYYCYIQESGFRGQFYPIPVARVKEIQEMNKKGEKPMELVNTSLLVPQEVEMDYESVNDVIELPPEKRKNKRRNKSSRSRNRPKGDGDKRSSSARSKDTRSGDKKKSEGDKSSQGKSKDSRSRSSRSKSSARPKSSTNPRDKKPTTNPNPRDKKSNPNAESRDNKKSTNSKSRNPNPKAKSTGQKGEGQAPKDPSKSKPTTKRKFHPKKKKD